MSIDTPRIFSFRALNRDTFYGLPGLIADSLPDAYGKVLLDRWLASNALEISSLVDIARQVLDERSELNVNFGYITERLSITSRLIVWMLQILVICSFYTLYLRIAVE